MGETCIQYLFFTEDDLARPNFEGAKFVCSPPVRTRRDNEALWRALQSGETVFIPDAANDPNLKHVKATLVNRKVRSITVVPISWRGVAIGAIFLRTFLDGPAFSEADVRFTQVVGSLTAKALRNAYRYERLVNRPSEQQAPGRQAEVERLAVLGFLRRFLEAFERRDGTSAEGVLPRSSHEELDRLVEIAMAVIAEEGKGR